MSPARQGGYESCAQSSLRRALIANFHSYIERVDNALWRWLREDVTYHHCHATATATDLTRRVAAFEARGNQHPYAITDRLWVKDHLDPDEEKLRFST
jgi:hypothetical protein